MFTQLVIEHNMSNGRERDILIITEKLTGLSFPNTGILLAGSSASFRKVQVAVELQI